MAKIIALALLWMAGTFAGAFYRATNEIELGIVMREHCAGDRQRMIVKMRDRLVAEAPSGTAERYVERICAQY